MPGRSPDAVNGYEVIRDYVQNAPLRNFGEVDKRSEALRALDALGEQAHERDEWRAAYEQARGKVVLLLNLISDAHEYHCGCDRPGDDASCIGAPSSLYTALQEARSV